MNKTTYNSHIISCLFYSLSQAHDSHINVIAAKEQDFPYGWFNQLKEIAFCIRDFCTDNDVTWEELTDIPAYDGTLLCTILFYSTANEFIEKTKYGK